MKNQACEVFEQQLGLKQVCLGAQEALLEFGQDRGNVAEQSCHE